MKKTSFFVSLLLFFYGYALALPKLIVTGDMRGEIKPCGCSEDGDLGGIERISTYFNQQSGTNNRIWIDLGNFSAEATDQGKLKNKLYEKLFISKKLFAILPGPLEFSKGLLSFKEYKLPYLITNTAINIENNNKIRTYRGNIQFFGYLSANLFSQGKHKTKNLDSLDQFILDLKKIAIKPTKKRVLLFRGSLDELARIDNLEFFDLIIPANSAESEENQILKLVTKQSSFLIPPIKGQGVLHLSFESPANKLKTDENIVWLSSKFISDSKWKNDFDQYQNRVEELFFAFLDTEARVKDKTVYKGAQHCISCHEKEGEIWKKSRHAGAWTTLERVKRTFDPDCISCHSVGFKAGGFLSKELTPKLASVQCESCHGITADHLDDGNYKKLRRKVDQTVCKQCHRDSHSPGFSFGTYFSKIKH